ncbi:MAG: isochorismate synthase [Pleurocapsa sp. MO_226.B13]|nr:isochorismate synthase [Pleurocapsa sp. MO_226.B13]
MTWKLLIEEAEDMKIFTWMQNTFQYLVTGVAKLFKPTNDDYPKTGVQPFTGDPNSSREEYS